MSSDQLRRSLESYLFATRLSLAELSRVDQDSRVASCDKDTVDERNNHDFLHFESALASVSGAYNQLDSVLEDMDTNSLAQINAVVAGLLKQMGSRVSSQGPRDSDMDQKQEGIDDIERVRRHVKFAVESGRPDPEFQQSLLPSGRELRERVSSVTQLNEMVEKPRSGGLKGVETGERHTPTRAPTENKDNRSHLESLYDHLAKRSCCDGEHAALFRLSGWDTIGDQTIFHMLLSSCGMVEPHQWVKEYHETSCTLESHCTHDARLPLDVCAETKMARKFQAHLSLSFNSSMIWETPKSPELSNNRAKGYPSLKALLHKGEFKTSKDELKKFRLAFRLASSLYHLYQGPWLPDKLAVENIYVFHEKTMDEASKLDEPYIHCHLKRDWEHTKSTVQTSKKDNLDVHSIFFLHFAQLLVDIAKGETRPSPPDDDPQSWFDKLADEVRYNFKDEIMESYGKAIQGCLLYPTHYRREKGRTEDLTLRAQKVIDNEIVSPLQKNLRNWQEQVAHEDAFVENEDERESLEAVHHAGSRPKAALGRQSPSSRRRTTAAFILFSHQDGQYPILTGPMPTPDVDDFTIRMEYFHEAYIQRLAETSRQNVRVAVIDTGFRCDDDDLFLQAAEGRVKELKCFVGSSNDYTDRHGHGTQVARLLLKYAPEAEIYVAKISNSRTLSETNVGQLLEADIINLSFGLGSNCPPILGEAIDDLIEAKKLIFAAASNSGGNGSRPWPANHPGVFCIHATNERGAPNLNMNPTAMSSMDNFATLGEEIESFWCGEKRCISGTSFATPIAAAIAANVLHFARAHLKKEDADQFMRYCVMRNFMRFRMTDNGESDGVYHNIKPWRDKLWTEGANEKAVANELRKFINYGN